MFTVLNYNVRYHSLALIDSKFIFSKNWIDINYNVQYN
jgi:hypothetical protein